MKRGSRNYPKLDKVLKVVYTLLAAIILTVLLVVAFNSCIKNTNDEAKITASEQENIHKHTGDEEEKDLTEENKSLEENEVEAAATAPKVAGKSIDYDKEDVSEVAEEEREDKDAANEQQSGSDMPWFLISIITLTTVANGCITIFIFRYIRESIKLQRERINLLSDSKHVELEDLQKTMRDLSRNTKAFDKQLSELKQNNQDTVKQTVEQTNRVLTEIATQSKVHGEGIGNMMDSFNRLNDKIKEQDKEITRYKEGYDTQNIKSSLAGYIKVRDRIQSYADNEKTSSNDLEKLLIIIESAIDNLGASEIEVKIGDNFYDDKYVGLTDDPEIIETDDPEKHELIASVVKKGYEIIGQERNTTIRNAKLKIYKLKPKEN